MKKLLVIVRFITAILLAFTPCTFAHAYSLRQIIDKDRLSNSCVVSLCQDQSGLLWIGTIDGINSYDGREVRPFLYDRNKQELSGSLVNNIIETEDGQIWIKTYYGLNSYNKYTNKLTTHFEGSMHLDKDPRNAIFAVRMDNKVVCCPRGGDNFTEIGGIEQKFDSIVNMIITPNGEMMIFCKNGTIYAYRIEYDGDVPKLTLIYQYEHMAAIEMCTKDADELFFIDKDSILFKFDYQNKIAVSITSLEQFKKQGAVIAVVRLNGDYYIGFKTGGLWCLRNSSDVGIWEEIPINCGIFTLLRDRNQDIIWIATDGKGVYSYSNDKYSITSTLSTDISKTLGHPVRCMHIENGDLWVGFKGDGIVKIDNYTPQMDLRHVTNIKQFTSFNSQLSDNSVFVFETGSNGILWIGHHDGLNYYSHRRGTMEKIALMCDGEKVTFVHDIYQQGQYLWIASAGMGVFKAKIEWTGDTPQLTDVKCFTLDGGSYYANGWFSLFPDGDYIYVANMGQGVMKIDVRDDSYSMLCFDGLIHNKTVNDIYCMSKDAAGNYLIGTGLGLVIYHPDGKYELLNRTNGFPENMIRGIMNIDDNRFWLTTNHGLINFDSETRIFSTFGVPYGLSVSEFSDAAQYRTNDDKYIMFGGVNGFVTIRENPENAPNSYMPKIQFNRLSVLGMEYGLNEFMEGTREHGSLELAYDQNFFSISFIAIDYLNEHNISYYYKLEGESEKWIDNGNSNKISFTNISPGTYKLLIKYYNRATNMEGDTATLQITITPPWYCSNIAKGIYVIVIAICIMFLVKYLMARSSQRHKTVMQKLEQQHKVEVYESKLSFFTNIAHEFCTPLSLIYGPVNQIIKTKSIDPSILRYAGLIKNNAERLNSLINDLIEFRQVETGHKTPKIAPIDISTIAEETISAFAEMASAQSINLLPEIAKGIEWNSDSSFIITILNNFISSAMKYADRGGVIKLNVETKDDLLGITISYTGKGIDKTRLIGLFDRYRILDNLERDPNAVELNSRDGLALAISYNLVQLLEGDIRVESLSGRWTHFYVSLPRQEALESNPKKSWNRETIMPEKRNAHIPVGLPQIVFNDSKLTMAVIDSEPEMLWFMTDLFSDKFNVICFNKILHMDAIFNDNYPDIIICNSMMPNLDILELTKYIKSNPDTLHISLIIISPKQEIEYQISVLDAGAELYIPMPFNVDYLHTSVEKLLSRKEELKEYFSSNISAFDLIDGKLIHKSQRKLLKEIIGIINKNIENKDLSAEFIATQMNMGIRKLYRQVEEIKGIGISGLIRECRLLVASDLLIKSRLTIDETAFKSGFSNRVSFYKAFTKKYNCTPKEYRDQNSKVG